MDTDERRKNLNNSSPLAGKYFKGKLRMEKLHVALYSLSNNGGHMKLKAIVHEAEEGGFWAEVPAIPGCATQGDSLDDLLKNLHEAVEGCLSVDVDSIQKSDKDRVIEISV